ncbi:MAG: hypothetical protein Q9195_009401 [Heterodermia aff. obscurata]
MAEKPPVIYTSGHHESVLRSHKWRSAANSAAYLLPSLRSDMSILDIGCGPGTITMDLAELVPDGEVIGLDPEPTVIDKARAYVAARGLKNIRFEVGSVHNLSYSENTFDVVHGHQILQHLGEPVQALREMRRVLKPAGIVACRETDFSVNSWYPESVGIEHFQDVYMRVARSNGGDPTAGRKLHAWAREAGFERGDIINSASTWCFTSSEEKEYWGGMWADRLLHSALVQQAIDGGHATQDDLMEMSQAWRDWIGHPDGRFVIQHGEILCRKHD